MASYTASQLNGAGTPIEALTAGVSYVFTIGNTTSTVVVENGGGIYQFTPTSNIALSSSFLRGTGGITLDITV